MLNFYYRVDVIFDIQESFQQLWVFCAFFIFAYLKEGSPPFRKRLENFLVYLGVLSLYCLWQTASDIRELDFKCFYEDYGPYCDLCTNYFWYSTSTCKYFPRADDCWASVEDPRCIEFCSTFKDAYGCDKWAFCYLNPEHRSCLDPLSLPSPEPFPFCEIYKEHFACF